MNRVTFSLTRNFGTCQSVQRWHKDKVENRHWFRYGYKDKVKQTGALPRVGEDGAKLKDKQIFEPENPFAPSKALAGQNDYIDILGNMIFFFSPRSTYSNLILWTSTVN